MAKDQLSGSLAPWDASGTNPSFMDEADAQSTDWAPVSKSIANPSTGELRVSSVLTAQSDLIPQNIVPASVAPGDSLSVNWNIPNQGTPAANSTSSTEVRITSSPTSYDICASDTVDNSKGGLKSSAEDALSTSLDGFSSGLDITQTANTAVFGSILDLANYLTTGYWAWNGGLTHFWTASPVTVNLSGLTVSEQQLATTALNVWHDVCNISFSVTSGSAEITYIDSGNMAAHTSWDNNIWGLSP